MAPPPAAARRSPDLNEFSALLKTLYGGAVDAPLLSEFLAQCNIRVGGVSAALAVLEVDANRWRYFDLQPGPVDVGRTYEAHYAEEDPVKAALLRLPPRRFYVTHELCDETTRRTHPYWSEWFRTQGYGDICAARVPLGKHYSCHLGFVRATGAQPFGRVELEFLNQLLPHVEQLLQILERMDRLKIMADLMQEHMIQSGAGCVVLNGEGIVNFRNRIASDLLRDGSAMYERNGSIHLADADADARLGELVRDCILASRHPNAMNSGLVAAPRPGALPLSVVVLPYHAPSGAETVLEPRSSAVVMIYDPARPRMDPPRILRELYRLSEAELQVCWRLANGETLDEIAAAEGVSRETVRSQLKRVFAKTGTSRQSELVRLILVGPALWAQGTTRFHPAASTTQT